MKVAPEIGQDPAGHAGDGRFARGPGYPDAHRRGIEQLRQKLGPRHDGSAEPPGRLHIGHGVFHCRRNHHDLLGAQHTRAVLRKERDVTRPQEIEFGCRPALVERAIRPRYGGAMAAQNQRQRQHPAAADAAEEIGLRALHTRRL